MTETVFHIVGNVGTDVEHRALANGVDRSYFRLATTPRHWDRAKSAFVDDPTNWLNVQCWRSLARNIATSLQRGDPVIVVGKLRTQEWEHDGVRRSRFIVEATAIGLDLTRGAATFTRATPGAEAVAGPLESAILASAS